MNVNKMFLVNKLNQTCKDTLTEAANLCHRRKNYDVEMAHWIMSLLEIENTDFQRVLRQYEINVDHLTKDVAVTLEKFDRGNSDKPAMSRRIFEWIQEAWLLASINYGATNVRSGHLILALVTNEELAQVAAKISRHFTKLIVSADSIKQKLPEIIADSLEQRGAASPSKTDA
ncbi:MAG TPA: Clp protease N-terminal domain-containing protein, partial [Pyrinomonadaceae bacterium]|nr:Clp protease N-terminal domain-containing protein [Pyrinomonadaceae bacterium]